MNAYHLLIMPINIKVDCTNIIKTDLQNRVLRSNKLCDSKGFLRKFSLIIVVSNDTKRKEIKKTIIGISNFLFWCLKTGSTLNGFDFCDVNLT